MTRDVEFAHTYARILDQDRDRARALAPVLARDVAGTRALVDSLSYNLGRGGALTRALRLAHALDFYRQRAQALSLCLDRRLTRRLVRDLARAGDLARDLARALGIRADHARALVRDITRAVETASVTAQRLVSSLEPAVRPDLAPVVTPWAVAVRLAHGAVRVLPAGGRCRYRDEFDSELYELTGAGASRWAQVMYGLRLIDRAWVLRAELREIAARGTAVRS